MQRGRVHRNVAVLVGPPAQRRSEAVTALDLDETRAVLAAAVGLRNSARWTVALALGLGLGLRQSEAWRCSGATSTYSITRSRFDARCTASSAVE